MLLFLSFALWSTLSISVDACVKLKDSAARVNQVSTCQNQISLDFNEILDHLSTSEPSELFSLCQDDCFSNALQIYAETLIGLPDLTCNGNDVSTILEISNALYYGLCSNVQTDLCLSKISQALKSQELVSALRSDSEQDFQHLCPTIASAGCCMWHFLDAAISLTTQSCHTTQAQALTRLRDICHATIPTPQCEKIVSVPTGVCQGQDVRGTVSCSSPTCISSACDVLVCPATSLLSSLSSGEESTKQEETGCPPGIPLTPCFVDPCMVHPVQRYCMNHIDAICRSNYCGGCNYDFVSPVTGKIFTDCLTEQSV